ncbi:uncharacterized protein LOC129300188 [Prosopis cineraria]|uniref:uncharacterized protein LOC129300188 n=1 Tax=Prosopis cineraria TaxID=364024 RepID=UPI00240F729B|nr:uncharacterized protein LOC129300188 [Prosopis cineraria]
MVLNPLICVYRWSFKLCLSFVSTNQDVWKKGSSNRVIRNEFGALRILQEVLAPCDGQRTWNGGMVIREHRTHVCFVASSCVWLALPSWTVCPRLFRGFSCV